MTAAPRAAALVLLVLLAAPQPLRGQGRTQAQADPDCAAVLAKRPGGTAGGRCVLLARVLTAGIMDRLRDDEEAAPAPAPRTFQTARADGAAPTGTPAQTEAVSGVQPTTVAAASLSAAGTDSGSKTIAAISLNPATLFGGTDNETVAKWSRVGDLTLLVPLSKEAPGVADVIGLRYLGLRGRLNLTGIGVGDALLSSMDEAFRKVLDEDRTLETGILEALLALPDRAAIEACTGALESAELGTAPRECKGAVRLDMSRDGYDALREQVRMVREKADARYFGLDLRADIGDPTLGADPDNDVTAFSLGLAYGQRFLRARSSDMTSAVRLRLAARYTDPKSASNDVLWAVEGGGGLEFSRLIQSDQYAQFSAGIDFRYSGSDKPTRDLLQPNFMAVRGGLTVPLLGGAAISVGLSAPVTGDVSPSLTANINWGMLLSSAPPLRQAR